MYATLAIVSRCVVITSGALGQVRVNAGNFERLLRLAARIVKRASNSDKAKENLHHDTPTTREADFEISKALTSGMYSLIFLKPLF